MLECTPWEDGLGRGDEADGRDRNGEMGAERDMACNGAVSAGRIWVEEDDIVDEGESSDEGSTEGACSEPGS